jgi:hypothetical protein
MSAAGLHELLIAALRQTRPHVKFRVVESPPSIVIDAKHPEVGDVWIWGSDNELTVCVGKLTHCHFPAYDHDTLPEAARPAAVVQDVVDYLDALFSDRRVIRVRERDGQFLSSSNSPRSADLPALAPNEREFVWSGPTEKT